MPTFAKNSALLAIAFWLGCAVFTTLVAANLFSQGSEGPLGGLSRDVAGAIAGTMLRDVYRITYICVGVASLFLLVAWLGDNSGGKGPKRALILCLAVLALNAVGHLWILEKVHKVKLEMGNPGDKKFATLKSEFDMWHKTSTWLYSGAMGCGALAAIFLLSGGGGSRPSSRSKSSRK